MNISLLVIKGDLFGDKCTKWYGEKVGENTLF